MRLKLFDAKTSIKDFNSILPEEEFDLILPGRPPLKGVASVDGHTPFTIEFYLSSDQVDVSVVPSGDPQEWLDKWGDSYELIPEAIYRKHIIPVNKTSQVEYWLVEAEELFAVEANLKWFSGCTWTTKASGLLPLSAVRLHRSLTAVEIIGPDFCGWEPTPISTEEEARIRKECELFNAVKWASKLKVYRHASLEFDDSEDRVISTRSYERKVWYDPSGQIQETFWSHPLKKDVEQELAARQPFPERIWLEKWLPVIMSGAIAKGEKLAPNLFDQVVSSDEILPF